MSSFILFFSLFLLHSYFSQIISHGQLFSIYCIQYFYWTKRKKWSECFFNLAFDWLSGCEKFFVSLLGIRLQWIAERETAFFILYYTFFSLMSYHHSLSQPFHELDIWQNSFILLWRLVPVWYTQIVTAQRLLASPHEKNIFARTNRYKINRNWEAKNGTGSTRKAAKLSLFLIG